MFIFLLWIPSMLALLCYMISKLTCSPLFRAMRHAAGYIVGGRLMYVSHSADELWLRAAAAIPYYVQNTVTHEQCPMVIVTRSRPCIGV